jgi:hypothetical protein
MITGALITQALSVSARLGIADLLAEAPKDCADLARATGTHEPTLYRVMRALASVGVFAEDDHQFFHLTPLAECLRTGVPGSLRAYAMLFGDPMCWQAVGDLHYGVQSGQPPFNHVCGTNFFQYAEQMPAIAEIFDTAMIERTHMADRAVVDAYGFSGIETLVDVGGGRGALLASILLRHPTMRGILFDRPSVVAGASEYLGSTGVGGRCDTVAGDFFVAVPRNRDAYVLKSILHDWDDERGAAILRRCRDAVPAHGRLLVVETIIPPGNEPFLGKLLDLVMLATMEGRERTLTEFDALLASAGFRRQRVVPTNSAVSIFEAVPA